jgi:hypothetical protein
MQSRIAAYALLLPFAAFARFSTGTFANGIVGR